MPLKKITQTRRVFEMDDDWSMGSKKQPLFGFKQYFWRVLVNRSQCTCTFSACITSSKNVKTADSMYGIYYVYASWLGVNLASRFMWVNMPNIKCQGNIWDHSCSIHNLPLMVSGKNTETNMNVHFGRTDLQPEWVQFFLSQRNLKQKF